MPADQTFTSFVIAILTALPAVVLALAALVRAARNAERVESIERSTNGQQSDLVRRLVRDAWVEGHAAGWRERDALSQPPPEKPPEPPLPALR